MVLPELCVSERKLHHLVFQIKIHRITNIIEETLEGKKFFWMWPKRLIKSGIVDLDINPKKIFHFNSIISLYHT